MKPRKKKFIRKCKNGTIFYLDKWGSECCNCEPFNILYAKHNQYLMDRNGSVLRISQMNEKGYEFSAYLFDDLKKNGYVNAYKLEQNIKEFYQEMIG